MAKKKKGSAASPPQDGADEARSGKEETPAKKGTVVHARDRDTEASAKAVAAAVVAAIVSATAEAVVRNSAGAMKIQGVAASHDEQELQREGCTESTKPAEAPFPSCPVAEDGPHSPAAAAEEPTKDRFDEEAKDHKEEVQDAYLADESGNAKPVAHMAATESPKPVAERAATEKPNGETPSKRTEPDPVIERAERAMGILDNFLEHKAAKEADEVLQRAERGTRWTFVFVGVSA
jgi:hypothetical protein